MRFQRVAGTGTGCAVATEEILEEALGSLHQVSKRNDTLNRTKFIMKTIVQTLGKIYFALEFANVESIHSLKTKLDQHESRIGKCAKPNSLAPEDRQEIGFGNVYYLSNSLPAR